MGLKFWGLSSSGKAAEVAGLGADQEFALEPAKCEAAAHSASMSHIGVGGNKGNQ